jgi:hypothetical protein
LSQRLFESTSAVVIIIWRGSFVSARLFVQLLTTESIFLFFEVDLDVRFLGNVLSVVDPDEGQEEHTSKDDQKESKHRFVIDDFSAGLISGRSLHVVECASSADITSDGDTVDADSLRSPDAVGLGVTLFHGWLIARLADALLINLTNFAHVWFLRACDVVEGVAEVAHTIEGSIVLGNPRASRISETELRGSVSTRLGSAARNTVVVPLAVAVGSTNTLISLGDTSDGVTLVVGPRAEAIHNAVIETRVTTESVMAARSIAEGASGITVAAESVGVVLASRSVDAHVVDNSAIFNVLRKSTVGHRQLRASSGVDVALVGSGIPVAASSSIATSLVGVEEARRGLAHVGSRVP